MKCPKCGSPIEGSPDAEGLFVCGACGAKLRSAQPPKAAVTLELLLQEIRLVRRSQEEVLSILRPRKEEPSPERAEAVTGPAPVVRARRAKSVLVIDDQDASRTAAVAALEAAQVPTRSAADGPSGLQAMAAERPDVIVLELGIGGTMAGKDVINMIKATMEWIDIPIVLWTRVVVESQKEARTVHGADEVVMKGPGAPEALVAKVIQIFRRG